MPPAHLKSAALNGIEAVPVSVEVDVLPGLPSFNVVGMGDKAIQESRQRLTAALTNLGYKPPRRKTIVSLAPATLKKEGSLYDLPITVGFLVASGQLERAVVQYLAANRDAVWFAGEVGLDGSLRPVRGVLPIALSAAGHGARRLYVPVGNSEEATSVADQLEIFTVSSLQELISHLSGIDGGALEVLKPKEFSGDFSRPEVDFADIKGQQHAKRALLVAAASSHHVLMVGPPGTGKTLLARALAGILPPLTRQESHVVTSLHSVAGLLPEDQGLIRRRPYRAPHHGASHVALVGGGTHPKPGEVSLAHSGVLFLDELPEFSPHALNQLRQPVEDGQVVVSRSSSSIQFPARSVLVGAMNPCPCGYAGSSRRTCQCSPGNIARYQRRVSGPLLDRFDLHVLVSDVQVDELLGGEGEESDSSGTSRGMAFKAFSARETARRRQGKTNGELTPREIKKYCAIAAPGRKLLCQAEERFHLSARGVHRLLKVSRTIADLEQQEAIKPVHLAEALQYREQLRQMLPDFV